MGRMCAYRWHRWQRQPKKKFLEIGVFLLFFFGVVFVVVVVVVVFVFLRGTVLVSLVIEEPWRVRPRANRRVFFRVNTFVLGFRSGKGQELVWWIDWRRNLIRGIPRIIQSGCCCCCCCCCCCLVDSWCTRHETCSAHSRSQRKANGLHTHTPTHSHTHTHTPKNHKRRKDRGAGRSFCSFFFRVFLWIS